MSEPKLLELSYATRNRHIYVAGASQHGKSTFLEHLIMQDIELGAGLTLLDPKPSGPLARSILCRIPPARKKDAIYLDIADPVPIDIMSWESSNERQKLQGEIFSTFTSFSPPGIGDQWPNVLRAVINSLLAARGCSFLDINRMLVSESFRQEIVHRVQQNNTNGIYTPLLDYWTLEFPTRRKGAEDPILSRMKQILFSPLAKLLEAPSAPLKLKNVIRKRQILIVNLGTLDDDSANLVGRLIVSKLVHAHFNQTPDDLIPHYLHADEFQSFQTSAFDKILAEAGGFRLCLCLANQGLYQLDDRIRHSVFTNVTCARIAFCLNHEDVPNWRHLLPDKNSEHYIDSNRLSNLNEHEALFKIGKYRAEIKPTRTPLPRLTAEQKANGEDIARVTKKTYAQTSPIRPGDKPDCDTQPNMVPLEGNAQDGKSEDVEPTAEPKKKHFGFVPPDQEKKGRSWPPR
jgi:hypothetical protein